MKAINLFLSSLILMFLFSCGSDNNATGGNGNPSGDNVVPVGKQLTASSSELAKEIANSKWCSRSTFYDADDTNLNVPYSQIYEFRTDGMFVRKSRNINTNEESVDLKGDWGANSNTLRLVSLDGLSFTYPARINETNGDLVLTLRGADPSVTILSSYRPCGLIDEEL